MPASPLVSDTSPLLYLGRIGQLDLLPQLFSRIYVPEQVVEELDAGRQLYRDILDPRQFPWMDIVLVSAVTMEALPLNALGPGERAAIAYAVHNSNTVVALDDRQARLLAAKLNLSIVGLVGIPRYGLTPQAADNRGTGRWPVRTAEPAVPLERSSPSTSPDLGVPFI